MFTDLNLTDMETCYKVFRREVIQAITPTLKEDRFGIEPELTAKVARRKYRTTRSASAISAAPIRRARRSAGRRLPGVLEHSPLLVEGLGKSSLHG